MDKLKYTFFNPDFLILNNAVQNITSEEARNFFNGKTVCNW
ncbi:MAG: hypothetical protein ACUVQ1_05670 [Candidatus Kapaibacteriales bacterium]